jgi:hypothetical protein
MFADSAWSMEHITDVHTTMSCASPVHTQPPMGTGSGLSAESGASANYEARRVESCDNWCNATGRTSAHARVRGVRAWPLRTRRRLARCRRGRGATLRIADVGARGVGVVCVGDKAHAQLLELTLHDVLKLLKLGPTARGGMGWAVRRGSKTR